MSTIGWPILGFIFPILGLLVTFLVALAKVDNRT